MATVVCGEVGKELNRVASGMKTAGWSRAMKRASAAFGMGQLPPW